MKVKYLITIITLVLLSFIIYNCTVNPVTNRREFSLLSESAEVRMGEEYYPIFTQVYYGEYPDANLQKYVQEVGDRLAKESHRPGLNYEFNVLNTSIPNAFALPGGKISITRGLLSILDSEDQLAGILGHEIGHVTARHSARRYSQTILAQTALAGAAYYLQQSDIKGSDFLIMGGAFGTQLLLLRYSRDNEREADELGIEYMTKAGYNPEAYSEVMEKFLQFYSNEPSRFEAIFSTHPLTSERVRDAKNIVNKKHSDSTNKPYKISTFQNAMQTINRNSEAYSIFDKGVALFNENKYDKAKEKFEQSISLFNNDALFHYYLSNTEYKLNNIREAKRHSDAAVRLYPDFFFARALKGQIEYELKNYNEAIINLNAANRLIQNNPIVIFTLAKSFDGLNDLPRALENYKKVVELTEDEEIINYSNNRISVIEN